MNENNLYVVHGLQVYVAHPLLWPITCMYVNYLAD